MRKTLRYFAAVLAAVFFISAGFVPDAYAAKKKTKAKTSVKKPSGPYKVSAKSAVLVDVDRLNRVYDKNSSNKVLPASTTKVMTALVVMERLGLDKVVTVSERAAGALPSKIYVKPGERYKVRDLLYACLLNSANDAAIVLAEAVAGSETKFVSMMNARARQLGAKNTHFVNSHGLPSKDPQHTTAHDMALIFREAMKKPFFRDAIKYKHWTIASTQGRKIYLKSHNKALFKGWKKDIIGKTGYTRSAQACFVGQVTQGKKTYIIAVFGCSRRWEDVKFIVERFAGIDL